MKVKIESEEQLLEVAREALHVMNNLRYATKMWNMHYGSYWKEKKKYYEERADLFLEKLQVTEKTDHIKQMQIEIEK